MNAIIMAGGEGTRLKAVTGDTPKPMAPLAGKPVLERILALLRHSGIRRACMTLRYRPEVIQDYFGSGERFGMELRYHVEKEPLGTAGGVRACEAFTRGQDFLVISGDCACDFQLKRLMEAHRLRRGAVTMALYPNEAPLQYGTVLTDRTGRVVSFIEKPEWGRVVTDLVNTGIYVVSPAAMAFVPAGRPFDFGKDLFPALLEAGKEIYGLPMEGYWCDIGTPRAYYQCNLDALDGRLRLPGPEVPAPRQEAAETPPAGTHVEEFSCRGRARLMRELSRRMMEAGEELDLSHGLALHRDGGVVRVSPAATREALFLSATAAEPARAEQLLRDCRALLRSCET